MLGADVDDWSTLADSTYIGSSANNPNTDWTSFIGGSYDDAQWVILALWKIADYKGARGENNSAYTSSAAKIYDIIAGQWDETCGGGVWWSSAHTYKNAITNQLFLLTSASGYLRGGGQTYLTNANNAWNWLENSGLRNSQGLWNDGLNMDTCQNNGETTWTYNQGVIASGLAALAVANSDTSLLDQAEITLDAVLADLTQGNILKESCDDAASGGATCDADQQIFKGVWTKHLQYYLDNANDAARTAKYSAFLGSQASAIYHYGKNADNDVGSVWYAPDQGGSVWSPKSSASGLAGLVSAGKYGPCPAF